VILHLLGKGLLGNKRIWQDLYHLAVLPSQQRVFVHPELWGRGALKPMLKVNWPHSESVLGGTALPGWALPRELTNRLPATLLLFVFHRARCSFMLGIGHKQILAEFNSGADAGGVIQK
jgi:hypothetical protein